MNKLMIAPHLRGIRGMGDWFDFLDFSPAVDMGVGADFANTFDYSEFASSAFDFTDLNDVGGYDLTGSFDFSGADMGVGADYGYGYDMIGNPESYGFDIGTDETLLTDDYGMGIGTDEISIQEGVDHGFISADELPGSYGYGSGSGSAFPNAAQAASAAARVINPSSGASGSWGPAATAAATTAAQVARATGATVPGASSGSASGGASFADVLKAFTSTAAVLSPKTAANLTPAQRASIAAGQAAAQRKAGGPLDKLTRYAQANPLISIAAVAAAVLLLRKNN